MTPKEALDFLVKNLPLEAQQTTSIYHTAIRVLLQSITELEELKKDVARFLEVIPKPVYRPLHGEAYELYEKLSKAGKTNE